MNTPMTADTVYGVVDRTALQALQSSYDTRQVLLIIDELDGLRPTLCDPDELRDDLLRLHAMAHTVINGAALVVPSGGVGLAQSAAAAADTLRSAAAVLLSCAERLAPLEGLAPQ